MAIDSVYDRTGQYVSGDTGRKVEGFAHGRDRRDAAIATMVGDGGPDSASGYGAILDVIENRISAIGRFGGSGAYGYYGKGLGNNYTLENVVMARAPGGSYQFSNWSPKNPVSYAITQRAYAGQPLGPVEQNWYDQAVAVYDDYYSNPFGSYPGVAQGGTYYQNAASLNKGQASFQSAMQGQYGALPVGQAGHVVTGPGLTAYGLQDYAPEPTAMPGASFGDAFDNYGWTDNLEGYTGFAGTADPMAPEAYGQENNGLTGSDATDLIDGAAYGDKLPDYAEYSEPAVPDAIGVDPAQTGSIQPIADRPSAPAVSLPDPAQMSYASFTPPQNRQAATAPAASWGVAQPQPQPQPRASVPSGVVGGTGNGTETQRRADGTIADNAGGYGGRDAFGPNDPFGGLGFGRGAYGGYADVIDRYDARMGTITRSVFDRSGRLVGQGSVGASGWGGEPTGERSDGGATRGDGSYSESSGRNENNPQGIY